jgi:hypothetical protein
MKIKKLRQKIYDDIQECYAEEKRVFSKLYDEDVIDYDTWKRRCLEMKQEYGEWEKDLMLTQDNDLRKKFECIMLKADKARENPAYHSSVPDRIFVAKREKKSKIKEFFKKLVPVR